MTNTSLQTHYGVENMNTVVKFSELPKELHDYIKVTIYNKGKDYLHEYACNYDELENSIIGLQVIKDYYKELYVFFINNSGTYTSVELGRVFNETEVNLTEWTNYDSPISIVKEQLKNTLTDYRVRHDYDREQIEDAIACGDFELVEDIVGDRDLAEFI